MSVQTMAHDPAGWFNFCQACHRKYWCAWMPPGKTKRMELDEVTPHRCEP